MMKYEKKQIKLSSAILLIMMLLIMVGVFASNVSLKTFYDNRDKSDLYWNYNKILDKPFKHLKIEGGNIRRILFEQNKKPSVRILNSWWNYQKDSSLKAYVSNDTLYLKFNNKYKNLGEKYYFQGHDLVRLFAPELLSIDGHNTNFELQKLRQANISINLKGKSKLEVETYSHNFDTLKVVQSDSSQVVFEMSPELKGSQMMHFKHVSANMKGFTLLDIGRSFIDDIKLNLADSSAIILSGKSLKVLPK
jgi:hypothetical protein